MHVTIEKPTNHSIHDEELPASLSPSDEVDDKVDPVLSKAIVRKQDKRIVPLCAGIYLLCYLDRSNIGNAKVLNSETKNDLLHETHMNNMEYVIALMVFLIAYGLFEVPSNILLKKFSPSVSSIEATSTSSAFTDRIRDGSLF